MTATMICSLGHVLCASLLPSRPSIPPVSLNWVPASAGVKAGMSPLSVGRWHCLSTSDSFSRFLALYKFVCMYVCMYVIPYGVWVPVTVRLVAYCYTQLLFFTSLSVLLVYLATVCCHTAIHGWDHLPRPTGCLSGDQLCVYITPTWLPVSVLMTHLATVCV